MKTYPTVTRGGIKELTAHEQEAYRRSLLSPLMRAIEDIAELRARIETLEAR